MNSNSLRDKRGILGGFIAMFGATIAIVLILVVFVLGAGIVKKIDNAGGGVVVYDEKNVEIDNIFDYMGRYVALLNVRFFLKKGLLLDESFEEGSYEK